MKLWLRLAVLIPLSLAAFIVLFILPDIDLGWVGGILLLAGAWVVWYLLWQTLREWSAHAQKGKDGAMLSPGEWHAWIGALFTLFILVYFGSHSAQMVAADGSMAPEAGAIGQRIGMLIVAWLVVMQILRKYWRDTVEHDERDRAIQAHASGWARGALTVFVIAMAVMFAFSPPTRLQWAVPMTLSNLLMAGVIGSCLLEYLVSGFSYWRGRRELEP